jgi:pimeloyl-ACP methyl ester carboxylesterase
MPEFSPELDALLKRFDHEAEHGDFDTGRYRCRYHVWGDGPPLVIVHGLVDLARSFAPLMASLASSFRCIVYELPNGLDDAAQVRSYQRAEYVADFRSVLDHFALERTAVLGSSFGSTIAIAAMHSCGDRISRGVLQGSFARRPLRRLEYRVSRIGRWWPGRMQHVLFRPWVMAKFERPAFANVDEGVYTFYCQCSGRTPVRASARRALLLNTLDLRPLLPRIPQPTLLIGGSQDVVVPRTCEEEVLSGLPNATRREIAGCGHYPQYTHAKEMAAAIRDFLQG